MVSGMYRRFAVIVGLGVTGCAAPGNTTSAPRDESSPTTQASGPRVVDFAPGVRIDYRVPQVEVDCEVILRNGDLELFAYSKASVPKEHESILRTHVRPEKVYHALGLIGLAPGQTLKYLIETKTIRPASGDKVDVLVRYEKDGETVEEYACGWMLDAVAKAPMKQTHWLFTGSEKLADGAFAADYEGTLVTVVDFPSSLLSLPTSHSESNDQLWLKTNTQAIPPLGTSVTLVLRPAK